MAKALKRQMVRLDSRLIAGKHIIANPPKEEKAKRVRSGGYPLPGSMNAHKGTFTVAQHGRSSASERSRAAIKRREED